MVHRFFLIACRFFLIVWVLYNISENSKLIRKAAEDKNLFLSEGAHFKNQPVNLPWNGGKSNFSYDHKYTWKYRGADFAYNLEWDEWILIDAFVESSDVIIEFGARYGTTSCQLSRKTGNSGKVISVDPDRGIYEYLLENRRAHQCNFHIVNGSVCEDKITFNFENTGYGSQSAKSGGIEVPNVRFQEIEERLNIRINVALIDCEGCIEFIDEALFQKIDLLLIEEDIVDYLPYYEKFQKYGLKCAWFIRDTFDQRLYWSQRLRHSAWVRPGKRSINITCAEYAHANGKFDDDADKVGHHGIICDECPWDF